MDTIIFACPNCKSLNKLPKKSEYKKAICGSCKANLLQNAPIELDDYNEFNKVISSVTVPIIIDFWAPWCGPCQMFAPTFKKVASNFPLKAQFIKVNTEINQQVAMNFQIRSLTRANLQEHLMRIQQKIQNTVIIIGSVNNFV